MNANLRNNKPICLIGSELENSLLQSFFQLLYSFSPEVVVTGGVMTPV